MSDNNKKCRVAAASIDVEGNQIQEYIKLKLICENDNTVKLRCKYNTKMEKVMKFYAQKTGDNVNSLRLLFNGRIIQDEETPKTLKMKDDAIIEVYFEQI